MSKRKMALSVLIITTVFVATTTALLIADDKAPALGKTWYVDDDGTPPGSGSTEDPFTTIQAAINAASPGDTIIIVDGIYLENVDVYKSLEILSENGNETTFVEASNPNDDVFFISADNVILRGFSIYGGDAAICLKGSDYSKLSENRCGWDNMHRNNQGIELKASDNNTISDNTVSYNQGPGISLRDDWSYGTYLGPSTGNEIMHNTVTHNTGAGIRMHSGHILPTYNSAISNDCNSNEYGVYVWGSGSNAIIGNTLSENTIHGVYIGNGSDDNTISSNTINGNGNKGVVLSKSDDNIIYLNSFNNTVNVLSSDSINTWNSPDQITYIYKDHLYTNHLGNYWNDYAGLDNGSGGRTAGDGVGDTDLPYHTDGLGDRYPLMDFHNNYQILLPLCGDVDCSGDITMNDGRQIFMNLIYSPDDYPLCDAWAADCDGIEGITMNDGRQIFMYLIYGADKYPLVCR